MISVAEAKYIIESKSSLKKMMVLPIVEANAMVSAEDIFAPNNVPSWPQSSMDGFAFAYLDKEKDLEIVGTMAAGTTNKLEIRSGQCVRIFTGAPLPIGADTVVMQEKTELIETKMRCTDTLIEHGLNVRPIASQSAKDSLVLAKNSMLTPAAIGFLAGIGIAKVAVFAPPKITIILTGNELRSPESTLNFGEVYEASSYMLRAALQEIGNIKIEIKKVDDTLKAVEECLENTLAESDFVLFTGGVSVGDFDFVPQACENCGVEKYFHKIKQRPGKPLFFGTKNETLIFGLPGNPSSSLVCFYQYVMPAIENRMGKESSLKPMEAILSHSYKKNSGLTHFLKGHFENGFATPLSAQESFKLQSFATANCLIQLEEEHGDYEKGDSILIYKIAH